MTDPWLARLNEHPFAAGLTERQLDRIAAIATPAALATGQRLFEEGGQAGALWLIMSGRIAIDLAVPGHSPVIIETVGAGEVLGLSWLTPAARWQFGASAQLPATTFRLASAELVQLCQADHELGYLLTRRLLGTAISRLQAARIRILDIYATPARDRSGVP